MSHLTCIYTFKIKLQVKKQGKTLKRACALYGVSVQASVETRTTQSVPFMQMAERTDSKIAARNDDHIEVTALKFKGVIDSLEKFIDRLSKSVARSVEIQGRKLDRYRGSEDKDRRSSTDSRDNRDSLEEVIGVIQIQVQKMIDLGLEVEEELLRPVLIATSRTMYCLTVVNLQKT